MFKLIAHTINCAALAGMIWIGITEASQATAAPEVRSVNDYLQTVRPLQRPNLWDRLSSEDQHCLALNVYHEARGEPYQGQAAVVAVTLNRVALNSYPDTVCEVVWQRKQFSWTHDGRSDTPSDETAWATVQANTERAVNQYQEHDHTQGADHYHAHWVNPNWADQTRITAQIGVHTFYDLR